MILDSRSFDARSWFPAVWFVEDESNYPDDLWKAPESQGVSNWVRFEPTKSVEVDLPSFGVHAFTGDLSVEVSSAAEVFIRGVGAVSGHSHKLVVSTSSVVHPGSASASSGSCAPPVQTSASCTIATSRSFAQSGAGVVRIYTESTAIMRPGFVRAGSRAHLPCLTVQNPTDDEIISWFMHTRRSANIDMLTSK